MNFKTFLSELKRRYVIKAGIAYLVVAWLITQVLAVLIPAFELSPSLLKTAIIVLSIGFPIWLVFSWIYDLTPEGLKRTIDVELIPGEVKKKEIKLNRIIIVGLSIAVVLLVYNQISMNDVLSKEVTSMEQKDNRTAIAVFPFANLSPDSENAFFSEGMHEDVLNKLAGLRNLRVMSRTAVLAYRDFEGDLKEIGQILDVQYVVEGTVSRWENEIKVTAKLVDVNTNETKWSNDYVKELKNVFELQRDIAQSIVTALESQITREEQVTLNKALTDNLDAYDNFLKAKEILNSSFYQYEELKDAIVLLEEAVSLDDNFIAGWSLLGISQVERYWRLSSSGDESELDNAKYEAELAIGKTKYLDPNSSYHYKAEGYYQSLIVKDKIVALENFTKALEIFPSDVEVLAYLPSIYYEFGQINKATEVMEKAYALDKTNGTINYGLTFTYELAQRYSEIVPILENLLKLEPEKTHYSIQAKYFQFLSDGKLESYKLYEEAVNTVEKTDKYDSRSVLNNQMVVAMFNNDYESYIESWKGKYDSHHRGHGNWACPMIINDEANQAKLMIENGKPLLAEEIINRAQENITRPYIKGAFCIFNKGTYSPKLEYMGGAFEVAKTQLEDIIPEVMNNEEYPRGAVERAVLLESADMVEPERVYEIYRQVISKPVSFTSMATICANPWTYPNLIKDPNFVKEVREDGRFVEFLQHYKLMSEEEIF